MCREVLHRQHPLTVPALYAGHIRIQVCIICREQLHKEFTINVHRFQGQKQSPVIWFSLQELMYQVSL